jgi:hypothetical protein
MCYRRLWEEGPCPVTWRKRQECFDIARTITLEPERAILIKIAQTYLQLVKEHPQPVAQQQEQIQPKNDAKKK